MLYREINFCKIRKHFDTFYSDEFKFFRNANLFVIILRLFLLISNVYQCLRVFIFYLTKILRKILAVEFEVFKQ